MKFIIYNILIVALFGGLAIYFGKWWIIFFALLFMCMKSSAFKKTDAKHCRVCDGCHRRSESAKTVEEAIERSKRCGWVHVEDGNLDFCPDCVAHVKHTK